MPIFWKKSRSIPVAVNVSVDVSSQEDTYVSPGREYARGSGRRQLHGQQQEAASPIRSSSSLSDTDSSASVQRPEGVHTRPAEATNPVLENINKKRVAAPIPVKLPSKARKESRPPARSRNHHDASTQQIQSQVQGQGQRPQQERGHKREPSDPKVESQNDIEAYGTSTLTPQFHSTATSGKKSGAVWIRRHLCITSIAFTVVVGLVVVALVVVRLTKSRKDQYSLAGAS